MNYHETYFDKDEKGWNPATWRQLKGLENN